MKLFLNALFLVLLIASPTHAQIVDWTKVSKGQGLTTSVSTTDAGPALSVVCSQPVGKVVMLDVPFSTASDPQAKGISFEYCGDGSTNYASVILGNGSPDLSYGYEAIFPLNSTSWKKTTLSWDSFVQSYLPWDKKIAQDPSGPTLDPSKITSLNFGWGQYFNKLFPTHASFQIRNVQLVDQIDPSVPPATFSEGWTHMVSLLGQKKPLKILLLGDSITDFGGDRSYGYFLGQQIKATWGNDCTVANCGIGGHTVRGGLIILPRSLRTMPDPDLVCILFGANDTKAIGVKPDFTPEVFKAELEKMIDNVRMATGGTADICLINGPARLKPNSPDSAGVSERIAVGMQEAAQEKKTAFVDSLSTYLKLTADEKKQYYKDTIHQLPAGLTFLGGLVFNQLSSAKGGNLINH